MYPLAPTVVKSFVSGKLTVLLNIKNIFLSKMIHTSGPFINYVIQLEPGHIGKGIEAIWR